MTAHLLKSQAFLRQHKRADMRRELHAAFRETFSGIYAYGREVRGEDAIRVMRESAYVEFLETARPAFFRMPPRDRGALLAALAEANPSWPEQRSARDEQDFRQIAIEYQNLGAYEQALGILERLVKKRPSDAALVADLGVCEYLSGRRDDSIRDLRSVIRLDSSFLPAYLSLGSIYERERRYEKALLTYNDAKAFESPGNKEMARILDQSRRRVEALLAAGSGL